MNETRVPAELTVVCDGAEYIISRRDEAALGPVWMIQVKGQYIGSFDALEGETETQVRTAAHTSPRQPNTANDGRQPCSATWSGESHFITSATSGGVNAPPHRALSHMIP